MRYYIISLLIILSSHLFSQIVIELNGNKSFPTPELIKLIDQTSANPETLKTITTAILEKHYHENGYWNTSFEYSYNDSNKILMLTLNEGKKFILTNIVVECDSIISENISENINTEFRGVLFNQRLINGISEGILNLLKMEGYIFSEVVFSGLNVKSESEFEKKIELGFSIFLNRRAVIDNFLVEGNTATNLDVILREGRIRNGEFFNEDFSDRLKMRLERLNIFSKVEIPEFYFDQNMNGVLKLKLQEGNTNSFDGIVGYIPDAIKNDGYFTGLVDISLRNLFGTYRALGIKWQKMERNSQEFELKYFEPYIFGLPVNLTPSFYLHQQDSTFVERSFNLANEVVLTDRSSIFINFAMKRIIPSENQIHDALNNSNSYGLGVGIKYDTRDNYLIANKGSMFRTDYFTFVKYIYGAEDEKKDFYQKLTADFEYYFPVFSNYLIFLSMHGKQISGDLIEIGELFKIGGLNTLRGYAENQFLVNKSVYSSIEMRAMLSGRNSIFLFYDVAYFQNYIDIDSEAKLKSGYGIGAIIESPVGLIKVNYGIGEEGGLKSGKIHFGLINGF